MKSRNRKAAQPRTQAAMNFDTPANPPNDLKAAIQHELKKSEDIFPDAASIAWAERQFGVRVRHYSAVFLQWFSGKRTRG